MSLPVDVRFRLERREFIIATRRAILQHPFNRVVIIFGAVLALGGYFLASSSNERGLAVLAWVGAVLCGYYTMHVLAITPGRAYDQLSPAVRESELQYRFTATGIELKSETFQARWDWSHFRLYTEEKEWFAVYPRSPGNFLLLPKRAIATPESLESLRELLAGKLRVW